MSSLFWRITLPMLGLLMVPIGETASAQENALSLPSDVPPDTVYGHLGDWFVVHDLEGETKALPDFRNRILFVNFWATWCAPCVEEMPSIAALTDTLDSEVEFLLISIDESARDVRRFLRKHAWSVPVYMPGWAPGASTFTAGIVPATFIVNRKGEIAYQHHGAANWNTEPIRHFLRELARR